MTMQTTVTKVDPRHDFDFLHGRWNVANRQLKRRFAGCDDWEEFPATAVCRPHLGGMANVEELTMPTRGYSGMALRLFDPVARHWSIYWANSRTGLLFPPVVGRFTGDRGEFYGNDSDDGRPVKVLYAWTRLGPGEAHWQQAFSVDEGHSWETNWVMQFTRAQD